MTKNKLQVCLAALDDRICSECINREIPFYFEFPVYNYWQANALINLGVSAIRIAGEIAHDIDYLNKLNVEIRVCPYHSYAPFGYKPLYGGWFRPEDLYQIDAIDVCELYDTDKTRSQALYRVYAQDHEWAGDIGLLIPELKVEPTILNRMFPPEFQERRNSCRMKCQSGGHCHWCDTMSFLAVAEHIRPLMEKDK